MDLANYFQIGTAIYYNIFNSQIKTNLPTYIAQAAIKAGLPQGSVMAFVEAITSPVDPAGMAAKVNSVTPQIIEAGALAAHWAFADSLKYVWYATIPFGIICMIACLFLPNIRKFMTNRLAVVSAHVPSPRLMTDKITGHSLNGLAWVDTVEPTKHFSSLIQQMILYVGSISSGCSSSKVLYPYFGCSSGAEFLCCFRLDTCSEVAS